MSSISSISSSAWQPVKPDVGKVSDKSSTDWIRIAAGRSMRPS